MSTKIYFPSGEQGRKLHNQIISEFNHLMLINDGKNKGKVLEKLAKKYGYSSGQAVRNMIFNKTKKQKQNVVKN